MGRCSRLVALTAATTLWLGPGAIGARAASMTVDCAHLQAALDQAVNGDTITLTQLCTKNNSGALGGQFDLNRMANGQSYTLLGQTGSGAGFDGTGVGGRVLQAAGFSPAALTLRNLTFENSTSSPGPAGGGAIIIVGDYSVTLDQDAFINNTAPGPPFGGGAVDLETNAPTASLTIINSTFRGNTSPGGVGGAVLVDDTVGGSGSIAISGSTFQGNGADFGGGALLICLCGSTPIPVTLTNNAFSGNQLTASCGCAGEGGAVLVANNGGVGRGALTQSGNRFTGNRVSGGTSDVDGGGESVVGMNLTSTGDVFTGNSIQAPAPGSVSAGAALSVQDDCTSPGAQHELSQLVLAGNSIDDGGTSADARGALSVGCLTASTPVTVTLNDSTISANSGGGGTAGIWGDPTDRLAVRNSIVTGNSAGADLTGFGGTGGLVTAAYSDLCSGSSPFAGTANICVAPALTDAAAGDVHETSSSPTVDAGSNALVPIGLATDVFGNQRIQPRFVGGRPVVDMGAGELTPIGAPSVSIMSPKGGAIYSQGEALNSSFSCTEGAGGPGISSCLDQSGHPAGSAVDTSKAGSHTFTVTAASADGQKASATVNYTVRASNRFRVEHVKAQPHGVVTFDLVLPNPGQTSMLETAWKYQQARAAAIGPQVPGPGRFTYAQKELTNARAGTLHVKVLPNQRGRRLVAHHRRGPVRINLWITYQPAHGNLRTVVFLGFRIRTR